MSETETWSSLRSRRSTNVQPTHLGRRLRIAVIGAGAAGLCSAKYLIQAGFDVTVFEIGTQLGGLWVYQNDSGRSSAYRTLHINTARNLTAFSDHPFPPGTQLFPDHWDMHRYLVSYAERFGVAERVRFQSEVKMVRPLFRPGLEPARWELELASGEREDFDAVISATGHLTKPLQVPEFQDFAGEYLHSHDYRAPEPFVGKRICIVGVGNSAMDIACDVCVNSTNTVLVARSGVMITPKLIFGIPVTDITEHLYRRWIPDAVRRRILRSIVWMAHGRMTDYGFKPLTKRAHATSSATAVMHIAYHRIKVKQGIDHIDGNRIHFVDGSADEFDTLIAATGYLIDLPFIPSSVLEVKDNTVDLYKRMAVPKWPGLWFVGMCNPSTALNRAFENQLRWICEFLRGNAILPSVAEMQADIQRKKEFIAKYYVDSPRHTIEEEQLPYLRELSKSMRAAKRRAYRGDLHGLLVR